MSRYYGWVDFIIRNFKSGTSTEIAKHIEEQAKVQKYRLSNKNVQAKVRQILPESVLKTGDKPSDSRKIVREVFGYSKRTKKYWALSDLVRDTSLFLDNTKKVKFRELDSGKISISTPKDKSYKHDQLLTLITDYARSKGYVAQPEKYNIDLLLKDNEKYIINEVKTYKNSIYIAVGQVQFYKYNLSEKYSIQEKNMRLNIVGDFKLDEKYKGWLKSLQIDYIHVDKFEDWINNHK